MNEILLGDCLELFKKIPDESVDVVFIDSPFNLGKDYKNNGDSLSDNDYIIWCKKWLHEIIRVLKVNGNLFIHNIPKWLTYYAEFLNKYAIFRHWIAWEANSGVNFSRLAPTHYGILYYAMSQNSKFYKIRAPHIRCRKCHYLLKDYGGKKDTIHPFGPLLSDVWTDIFRVKHKKYKDNDHPCALPVHLLERIILMSSDEGDTILDPFSGTGTTAVAAKKLGRNYIGFDISEDYVGIANKNIADAEVSKVGNVYVSKYRGDVITARESDIEALKKHMEIPDNAADVDFHKVKFN